VPHVEYRSSIDASAQALFAWHARPGAFQRLTPPWLPITLEQFEGIQDGQRAVLRLGYGPASVKWVAEHFDYVEGEQFCDRQVRGPFERWTHVHRMEPDGPDASTLIDAIDYELPLGGLGAFFGSGVARDELDRQFRYRHRITQQDLDLHQHYNPDGRTLTVAISGASGLIGSQLTAFLTAGGHAVKRLTRSRPVAEDAIYWNPREEAIDEEKLEGIDAVIHLAGENVFALRWTEAKKDSIMHSRRVGTRLLAEALAGLDDPPEVFLSASGVSYYGDHGTDTVTEDTPPPRDPGFLSKVCRVWEQATQPAADAGIRTAQFRTGIVLTPAGGALQLMLPPFRLGLGGRIGAPDQYFPWIALDDVIGGYVHGLWTEAVEGPVNLTAPEPATMDAYAKTLAGVLNRPALLNVPGSAVRAALGEIADAMLLQSTRALPKKLQDTGYTFRYPALDGALRHLLGKRH
jgi:hypothetical protein